MTGGVGLTAGADGLGCGRMEARRLLGVLLVATVLLVTAGTLFLADDCEEDCSPTCGDCTACGLVADRAAPPPLPARLAGTLVATPLAVALPSSPPRQLDHGPLAARPSAA